ncbi:MAG: CTP synthase, partial [Spirosomaceae bacterium]|nr:CTP synthase [Spirosomataceae bacterium]
EAKDAETIYDVPLLMKSEKLDQRALYMLDIYNDKDANLDKWKDFLGKLKNPTETVTIGLIGKYVELQDAYKSISESFIHGSTANECKVNVEWIHSESLTPENVAEKLKNLHGLLVAPGFGERGIEGKVAAVQYARENNLPFFGICLGMQMAVIEYARNVVGLEGAHSTEMNPNTKYPVIDLMNAQKEVTDKGGTMRVGAYACDLQDKSLAKKIYKKSTISERHRHRWELNNKYLEQLTSKGLIASGINPETNLVEIIELKDHPFFIGVQFHPELKSTVMNPHPIFVSFIKAAIDYKNAVV